MRKRGMVVLVIAIGAFGLCSCQDKREICNRAKVTARESWARVQASTGAESQRASREDEIICSTAREYAINLPSLQEYWTENQKQEVKRLQTMCTEARSRRTSAGQVSQLVDAAVTAALGGAVNARETAQAAARLAGSLSGVPAAATASETAWTACRDVAP